MAINSIKFLQLSDVHLDRPMFGGTLGLATEKAEILRQELKAALAKAITLAVEEAVDIILIAGDLFEEENLVADTIPFLHDLFRRVSIPVVIAPGNEDFYSAASHYSNNISFARFGDVWPENVHIFRKHEFSTLILKDFDGLVISGIAHATEPSEQRLLTTKLTGTSANVHIGIMHGSLDDNLPPGKSLTQPFSNQEVFKQPFDYLALGHYHESSSLIDERGLIRAAYSGSLCPFELDVKGPFGLQIGTVEKGGVRKGELSHFQMDDRRIIGTHVDVTGLSRNYHVENAIQKEFEVKQVKQNDIVLVELTGSFPTGSRIQLSDALLEKTCFSLRVNTENVKTEWSMNVDPSLNPSTTEAVFRNRLKDMMDEADSRGDQTEYIRLQNALYYGLDAIYKSPIKPRQV